MNRMTKQNLCNIKDIFETKTGTVLRSRYHFPVRKMIVLAAVIVCCFTLAAFTYPLFTPLAGDELALSATYEGEGIVSVFVVNGSEKDLVFEEQLKLFSWSTGEEIEPSTGAEIEPSEGKVRFYNTKISAHSSAVMTIDLSEAYDMEVLEATTSGYYLLLTNNDFLFGHDWICSFHFSE